MRHPLTDDYRAGRERLIDLGRSLSDADGSIVSAACPAWTVKDLFSHLAGISSDIVSGNTEGAATEAWADGHVADRIDRSLREVVDEWAMAGVEVSNAMESFGEAFPLELFLDQWTHEWDIRAALGSSYSAEPVAAPFVHYFDEIGSRMAADALEADLDRLVLDVDGRRFDVGTGRELGVLPLSMFEFARTLMGRRSASQLAALPWPMGSIEPHVAVLVRWSVAATDIVDPVG